MISNIVPEKIEFDLDREFERYWLNNSPLFTHFCNTFTLLFPIGESFFIKSIKPYLNLVSEPLKADMKAFIRQELNHSKAHLKMYKIIDIHGYKYSAYIDLIKNKIFPFIENNFDKKLNVSITFGFEFYTSFLSEFTLESKVLENGDKTLTKIFEWHCKEELSHRNVIGDLVKELDISYPLIVLGFLLASLLLAGSIFFGMLMLLTQDGKLFSYSVYTDFYGLVFGKNGILNKIFSKSKELPMVLV
jgi:uncharacterized protein